jgi:7-cyano-7-deazaguanine synthase
MPALPPSAVALLSSGLDSSVALAMHLKSGAQVTLALTVDYGQRARKSEVRQASRICEHLGIRHQVVELPWMSEFPSGLTSKHTQLPQPTALQLDELAFSTQSAKAVWVPNRNGILIEIAAGFAESLQANQVLVGFNREEAATFADNSADYLSALTRALGFSTSNQVQVVSPTATMDKTEIVRWARKHQFPLQLVWSCYEDLDEVCGRCESCQRFQRAVANAGDFK